MKIKCNRASVASEKIFEKIREDSANKRLSNLVFLPPPLNFSSPPFSRKYAWFLFPLVFSRTQAASMLQWSRRPWQMDIYWYDTRSIAIMLHAFNKVYYRGRLNLGLLGERNVLHIQLCSSNYRKKQQATNMISAMQQKLKMHVTLCTQVIQSL